jgi:hypothetical protein
MNVLMIVLASVITAYIVVMAWAFTHEDTSPPPDKWEAHPLNK